MIFESAYVSIYIYIVIIVVSYACKDFTDYTCCLYITQKVVFLMIILNPKILCVRRAKKNKSPFSSLLNQPLSFQPFFSRTNHGHQIIQHCPSKSNKPTNTRHIAIGTEWVTRCFLLWVDIGLHMVVKYGDFLK